MKKRIILSLLLCLMTGAILLSGAASAETFYVTFLVDGDGRQYPVEYEEGVTDKSGKVPDGVVPDPLEEDQCFTGWFFDDGTPFIFGETVVKQNVSVTAHYKPDHGEFESSTVESTCTKNGKKIQTCPDCGYKIVETLEKAPHNLTKVDEKPSTCETLGTREHYVCSICKNLFLDADGETMTDESELELPKSDKHSCDLVEEVASDCKTAGTAKHWKCRVCNKLFADEDGKPGTDEKTLSEFSLPLSTEHTLTYVDGEESTCTKKGKLAHWACSVCGKIFSDETGETELNASDIELETLAPHELIRIAAVPANCKEPGTAAHYKCQNCDALFLDQAGTQTAAEEELRLPVTSSHRLTQAAARPASCTETGTAEHYVCTVCGKKFSDEDGATEVTDSELVTEALGHTLEKVAAVTPTCTTGGQREYYRCTRCQEIFADADGRTAWTVTDYTLPAAGHTMLFEPGTPYSCTTDGIRPYYRCDVCKKNFEDRAGTVELKTIIVPAHHSLYLTEKKEATCTEKGHVAYYTCYECGEYFKDEAGLQKLAEEDIVTPLAAHQFKNGICTVCGEEQAVFKAQIIKGNAGTASYGYEYSFTLNTDYETVKDSIVVRVDGLKIAASSFSVTAGSTVVTLTADYIKSLTPGAYDISFETAQGTASGTFKVSRSPKTGDESNPALWAAVGLMSAAAVAGIGVYLARRKKK